MCAFSTLTKDLNIFAIEPIIHQDLLIAMVKKCFGSTKIDIASLRKLLSPSQVTELVNLYLNTKELTVEHITTVCKPFVDELNKRACIPFNLMTVVEGTALIGPFNRRVVTPAEWYGEAYNVL